MCVKETGEKCKKKHAKQTLLTDTSVLNNGLTTKKNDVGEGGGGVVG